jgi:hypothetical protein
MLGQVNLIFRRFQVFVLLFKVIPFLLGSLFLDLLLNFLLLFSEVLEIQKERQRVAFARHVGRISCLYFIVEDQGHPFRYFLEIVLGDIVFSVRDLIQGIR